MFEARADNDYLMFDALLSKMKNPCTVEMLVCPVDQTDDLEAQYRYITRLRSVNEYSDESDNRFQAGSFFKDDSEEQTVALPIERRRDPMADDIAQEHQEFHKKLRQPQLLFNIKTFARNQENALMLASAIAESGFAGGKYSLVSYNRNDSGETERWQEQSFKDSCSMEISLHAMHPGIWDAELPVGYKRMARLCRMAGVDELKGIVRLPVGGHGSPRCIRKRTDPEGIHEISLLIGDDLESNDPGERSFGDVSDLSGLFNHSKPSSLEARLPLQTLTKHMFVAGVPGSGKTTAVYNMLVQLFRAGRPFLVIEPAKTEYRVSKDASGSSGRIGKEYGKETEDLQPR